MVKHDLKKRSTRIPIGAFTLFIALYFMGFSYLNYIGYKEEALTTLFYFLAFTLLAFITSFVTRKDGFEFTQPKYIRETKNYKNLNYLHILFCFVIILIFTQLGISFDSSEPENLTNVFKFCYHWGILQFLGGALLVFAVLVKTGAHTSDFKIGYWRKNTVKMIIIWTFFPLIFIVSSIINHQIDYSVLLITIIRNIFQNGFTEEFLFRGALLGKLQTVLRSEWALFIQAIAFGIWHYGLDIRTANGDVFLALSFMICVHCVFGYALGFLTIRTKSIWPGSIFHTLADATQII